MSKIGMTFLLFLFFSKIGLACDIPGEDFRAESVLDCPVFASRLFARMELTAANSIKQQTSQLRHLMRQKGIKGDVQIKVGIEIVSPEEVWFRPEIGLFVSDKKDIVHFNQKLQRSGRAAWSVSEDELLVSGAFHLYMSYQENGENISETIMGPQMAEEWPVFSGDERRVLAEQMSILIPKLRANPHLDQWKRLLNGALPKEHTLSWSNVEDRRTQKLRLSTYFDFQWFSASNQDNGVMVSDLIEAYEVDLLWCPQPCDDQLWRH